jgi:hypothetical protein
MKSTKAELLQREHVLRRMAGELACAECRRYVHQQNSFNCGKLIDLIL